MKLATITRYETSSRPWNRLIEIAADRFPDTVEDLTSLQRRKVKLELRINADASAYDAVLVGPDVAAIEQLRTAQGPTAARRATRCARARHAGVRGDPCQASCPRSRDGGADAEVRALGVRGIRIQGVRRGAVPIPGRNPVEHRRKQEARQALVVARQDAVAPRTRACRPRLSGAAGSARCLGDSCRSSAPLRAGRCRSPARRAARESCTTARCCAGGARCVSGTRTH